MMRRNGALLLEALLVLFLVMLLFVLLILALLRLLFVLAIRRAARQSAFAAGFGGEFAILGKAAAFRRHGFTALAACARCKLRILREAALLGRNTLTAFAGDLSLFRLVHRGKTAVGFLAVTSHDDVFLS